MKRAGAHLSDLSDVSHRIMRQRRASASAALAADVERSSLATYLLYLWSWGMMSPQSVQKIASRCKHDIELARSGRLDMSELEVLSSLGSNGVWSSNCHSDLLRKLVVSPLSGAIRCFTAPVRNVQAWTIVVAKQAFLLPHVAFSTLYYSHTAAFHESVTGGVDKLKEFWQTMAGSPRLSKHPVRDRRLYRERAVPISVHGDGVPVTGIGKSWSKSCEVISWCGMMGAGATLDVNFYIFSIFAKLLATGEDRHTMMRVWTIVCWSLHWLWLGLWPDVGPEGC